MLIVCLIGILIAGGLVLMECKAGGCSGFGDCYGEHKITGPNSTSVGSVVTCGSPSCRSSNVSSSDPIGKYYCDCK